MSRLLLVRHGQSTWNAEGRWQGQADAPLSARGEAQARAAGPAVLALAPFDVIACSPLQRARRTAELLTEALRAGGVPAPGAPHAPSVQEPLPVPGLEERAAGAWTGLTHAEIDATWPGARAGTWRPDDYEAEAALRARAVAALLQVRGDRVLVVVHEGVLRALDGENAPLPNLGARWFVRDGGRITPAGPRLALAPESA